MEREDDEDQHRTSLLVKVKQQLFVNVPKLLLNDTEDKEEIKKELGPKGIIRWLINLLKMLKSH